MINVFYRAGEILAFGFLDWVETWPRGLTRFTGYLLFPFVWFVTIPLQLPLLFLGHLCDMWDEANR
jgi:hypothetical protein